MRVSSNFADVTRPGSAKFEEPTGWIHTTRALRPGVVARLVTVTVWLALVCPALVCPAWAQTENENRAAARALAVEGVALAEAGDCYGAIDRFSRAEQLFHAPTILTGLGECQCKVGLLVEGTENLNRVARENLGADAPEAFVEAQNKAKALLQEYLPKVAKLTISVQSPSDQPYSVSVDGASLPPAMVGVARPINPGDHEVTVQGDAYLPASGAVSLAEGQAESVTIQLELRPIPEVADEHVVTRDPIVDEPAEPNRVPAYIAFGVGAVGLGVGTVFGLSAKSTQDDLDATCRNGSCPSSAQGDIDSMQSDATLATVGFGLGLVAVGAGVYLWLSAEPEGSGPVGFLNEGSRDHAREGRRDFGLRAYVAPAEVGLSGEF